jgi:hypothetical protein
MRHMHNVLVLSLCYVCYVYVIDVKLICVQNAYQLLSQYTTMYSVLCRLQCTISIYINNVSCIRMSCVHIDSAVYYTHPVSDVSGWC